MPGEKCQYRRAFGNGGLRTEALHGKRRSGLRVADCILPFIALQQCCRKCAVEGIACRSEELQALS